MKKSCLVMITLVISLLTLVSCNKKQNSISESTSSVEIKETKKTDSARYTGTPFKADSYSEEKPEYKERNALHLETNGKNLVDFNSVNKFFTLDYTPEYPDSVFADFAQKEKETKKKKGSSANKEETSESYIPGIRKLANYITKYTTTKASIQNYTPADEVQEDDETKEFYIEDWGPQGKIVAGENHPTFYVIFSCAARSLQALDKPQTTSDIMTIEPALQGVFRWYGTKHLSFESDVPADPTVQYKISIKEGLKSAGGKSLTGETVFQTQAEPVEVTNLWGGYIKDSDCAYNWDTGALPPYENRFVMRTNYTTTISSIKKNLTVYVNDQPVNCDIQPVYKDIFEMWSNHSDYDEGTGRTNTWLAEIKTEVPHGARVVVKNTEDKSEDYYTLMPFTVNEVSEMTEYSSAKYKWPLTIYFSQVPDKRSLVENLTYDDGKKITEDNIVINGRTVKLCNLPFDYKQEHTISFGNIIDKFNQPLTSAKAVYSFKTPEERSYVRFQNYGTTMLEAQFPHKMLFEHQNLLSGNYILQKSDRPSNDGVYTLNKNDAVVSKLNIGIKNQRNFQELDLEPFLDDGYGFVRYEANVNYKEYNQWKKQYQNKTSTMKGVVQVTDLGITARMAFNKAVVMVRSLSTGKPVENAEVYIVHNLNDVSQWVDGGATLPKQIFVPGNENSYNNIYAKGVTDKNGFAVINYEENAITRIENDNYNFVYVVNGKDKAAFIPESHNTWRSGVRTSSLRSARKPAQRTFMFVDRGIYKPGETVIFRGIDRDQLLGTFTPHKGSYTIDAKGAWYDSKNIIETITGELSESGGFYGSFKIPDNTERGYYHLVYRRTEETGKYDYELIRFTIADFERVKFESSITVPEISYFGGDKLTANLSADYLAGGSLGGAKYEVSWYKQATTFKTSDPAAKGYNFYTGVYPDRNYYSNDTGSLGVDGTASLSCESEKITDGAPYLYHVESAVTDVSNQRIAADNNIFVHPAQFYVGISKARNIRGFAKSGEKIEIPYILVNTDGKVLNETDVPLKVSELEYSLSHEEWTMVHEQSVDDTIYTRYERKDVEDEKGSLKAVSNGLLPITPKTAGWYTLTITGKDSRGNKVICKSEFYVTGSGASWFDQYNSYSLNLTPDKSQYNPGETARVLLESPLPAGDYLITVEREGIFTEEIRHFDNNAEVLEIPIAGNYVPVVYVSVSSYSERHGAPTHEYGEPDLDKPKGYYGVTPLLVNPYVRSFSVAIECDKPSYKPGDTVTIKFKATKGGKPYAGAELTAMAVDRGVLDLINYHVPNPIDYFYDKYNFPLRVDGGDSRALLMDPVTYSVKNLMGGDAADEEKEDERKDFRPTAFFEPVLITDKNGEASVTFKMPDSLTSYRITAFGVKDDLFALQEDEVKVQNPINIQQVQPRRLRERDTAECGVLITNLGKDGQKVTVNLEVLSPTQDTEQDKLEGRKTIPGKGFVDGDSSHTVYVASGQSSVVYFDVAAQTEGTINLVYTIKSDLLNERLISPIRIEKTFVYETVTMTGSVSDSGKASEKESLIIPGFAKQGRGDLNFTLDATRLGVLGSSVNYLFDYPYGCLEQQSSRILPLVSFDEYIDVFGLDSKVGNIKDCVHSWTKNWKDYQHSDGGFGYWPESIYSSDFVSMRILYVYALAMTRGYTQEDIPINIESLKRYVAESIKSYKTRYPDSNIYDYDKAFGCYVFSLLKDNSLDALRDELFGKIDSITLDAAACLSLAYSNSGSAKDLDKAKAINKKLRSYLQPDQRSVTLSKKTKSGYWFCYQNETVQYAVILSTLVSVDPKDEMVDRLIYTLLGKQAKGRWQNTITTSAVLDSIYTYIQKRNLDATDFTATAILNGKEIMKESFKGVAAKPKTLHLPFEDEFVSSIARDKTIPVEFTKDGKGYLFYTVEMKYALPDETQAARNEGLKITYEITDFDTGELVNAAKDTCDLKLQTGKIYKAKVFVETNRTREYVAVRAPIPSGAEILDSTLVTNGSAAQSDYSQSWRSRVSHKNITDNEVQFFWDEMHSGSYFFDFTFRATRRGVYPTPPVQGECMYEPEVFGRSDGYLFVIE